MNNGILVQSLLDKPSSDNGLTRTLSGPNPISLPYNYPGDDSWRIDKNSIALVFDTRYETDTSVTIPLGGSYSNIIIDWGDGKRFNYSGSSNITYQYASHGLYIVQIYGTITSLGAAVPISNRNKLIKCLSLGNTITSLQWAFSNSSNLGGINLIIAPDQIPRTCTSLNSCFAGCVRFNDSQLKNWNTSNITNMGGLFNGGTFNQQIDSWDTSNVTDFSFAFQSTPFNQPIGNWNVGKVTNFAAMFNNSQFNQDISNWNTSSATNMSSMFALTRFNQNIGNWNISNVTSFSSFLFHGSNTCPFDQNLSSWNINSNVSASVDMSSMFRGCFAFNNGSSSGINNWNTSRVTNTSFMFAACFSFNQPLDSWNVSNITNMSSMFLSAASFNQSLNSWNTSNATNMQQMFQSASSFNQPLDNWNVRKVTNFANMFDNAIALNSSLSGWALGADTAGASCLGMFQNARYNQPLSSWDTSKVTNMGNMFAQQTSVTGFNQDIGSWNTSSVTNMSLMFYNNYFFNNGGSNAINNWNTSNVTNMNSMFYQAGAFNQPIGNWNVSKVTNMGSMFYRTNLFNQDISGWNLAGLNANTSLDNFMLDKTGVNAISTANYDALLIGWNNNKLVGANGVANWRTDLRPNFGGAKYTAGGAAAAARAALVSYGWTITDGGTA